MNIKILIQSLVLVIAMQSMAYSENTAIGMIIEKEQTATYTETLEGLMAMLEKSGKHYNFIEKNAKQSRKTMKQLAKDFAADKTIELVVVLGSAAASIANKNITNKPVIFGGINHPGALGIKGDNITGTTYYINPAIVVNLIMKLNPDVKKVGILYEAPEQNAASAVEVPETEAALSRNNIEFIKAEVKTKEDIVAKTKRIIKSGVQYLIIPTNRLLYANVSIIRSVCDRYGVPVVSFSRKGVHDGALIAITSDNRAQGEKMAQMLIDIVERNKATKDIKWYFPQKYTIIVNQKTKEEMGISIPHQIYSIATIIESKTTKSEQNN